MKSNHAPVRRPEGSLRDFRVMMTALRPLWFLATVLLIAASLGIVLVAW